MRDALEDQLVTHLRTLGDTVDDEFPPPADLERLVLRRRTRTRARRRWSSLGVAAAIVAAAATVAIVRGTTGGGSIRIATSPTTLVPVRDSLQPGTVMLSARGRYVVSLDATGADRVAQLLQTATSRTHGRPPTTARSGISHSRRARAHAATSCAPTSTAGRRRS